MGNGILKMIEGKFRDIDPAKISVTSDNALQTTIVYRVTDVSQYHGTQEFEKFSPPKDKNFRVNDVVIVEKDQRVKKINDSERYLYNQTRPKRENSIVSGSRNCTSLPFGERVVQPLNEILKLLYE